MYYDNKSTFYLKQYGPAVVVSVLSLVLIASGVYIYIKSSDMENPFKAKTEINQAINTNTATINKDESVKEEDALVNEPKIEEVAKTTEPVAEVEVTDVKYFENLVALEKSKDVNVIKVSDSGKITLEINGDKLEVTLIGIDFKYSKGTAVEKIKTDLLDKKVKMAFGKLRSDSDNIYAYIFKDNSLYNADLLKTGLVTLKTERTNIELNNDLSAAQAYARQNSLGVWKK